MMYWRSAPLDERHDLAAFNWGVDSLDQWLRERALRAQRSGTARTYVWTAPDSTVAIAYFAISPTRVQRNEFAPVPNETDKPREPDAPRDKANAHDQPGGHAQASEHAEPSGHAQAIRHAEHGVPHGRLDSPCDGLGHTCVQLGAVDGRHTGVIPAYLLGRLALDRSHRGHGLGTQLLLDALERIVHASESSAAQLIVVDTGDPSLASFYAHHDFQQVVGVPRRLVMKVATARAILRH